MFKRRRLIKQVEHQIEELEQEKNILGAPSEIINRKLKDLRVEHFALVWGKNQKVINAYIHGENSEVKEYLNV